MQLVVVDADARGSGVFRRTFDAMRCPDKEFKIKPELMPFSSGCFAVRTGKMRLGGSPSPNGEEC